MSIRLIVASLVDMDHNQNKSLDLDSLHTTD